MSESKKRQRIKWAFGIVVVVIITAVVTFVDRWAPPAEKVITTEVLRLYKEAAKNPHGIEAQYLREVNRVESPKKKGCPSGITACQSGLVERAENRGRRKPQ